MQIFIYAFAAAYDVECSGLMPTFLDNNKILWMNDVIYHFHYIRTKHIFFRVTGWNVSCFVYPDWTYLSSCIRNVYITPFTRIEHIFLRVSGLNVSGSVSPDLRYPDPLHWHFCFVCKGWGSGDLVKFMQKYASETNNRYMSRIFQFSK